MVAIGVFGEGGRQWGFSLGVVERTTLSPRLMDGTERASLVTFVQVPGAPATAITLEVVNRALDQNAQESMLNAAGPQLICYGSLYIQGTSENVAIWRD